MCSHSLSVTARDQPRDDDENFIAEFCKIVDDLISFVLNYDSASGIDKDVLDKLEFESAWSVFVSNHNLRDAAAYRPVLH